MTEQQATRHHRRCGLLLLCLLLVLALYLLDLLAMKMLRGFPEKEYTSIEEHFKYGSIGTDTLKQGFPYWIWKVLPTMFKDLLPPTGKPGYEAFGLIVEREPNGNPKLDEDGHAIDRPVGFSKRRIGFKSLGLDIVGLNCAFCHASTLRRSDRAEDTPKIILGMPGHTVDVEEFLVFLFNTAKDPRFTDNEVMKAIEKQRRVELPQAYAPMGFIKATAYQWIIIPLYRWEIGKLEQKFCFIKKVGTEECATTKLANDAGPGRLDLWATYKVMRFDTWIGLYDLLPDLTPAVLDSIDMDIGPAPGFADTAPLWQLDKRVGRGFHWDGNTSLLNDYTIIAALGMNVITRSLDVPAFNRIVLWAKMRPPPKKYDEVAPEPFKVKADLRDKGKALYFQQCASCHDVGGRQFGMVEPIETIGTDRNRFDAFTEKLAVKLRRLNTGHDWKLHKFAKTSGYSNLPLDGIWLRAPYLHNGSVPTLADLLKNPEDRPQKFCRGNDLYNWDEVGFASALTRDDARPCGTFFLYDTSLDGNGNRGHIYGTDLDDSKKKALIEFLKTL